MADFANPEALSGLRKIFDEFQGSYPALKGGPSPEDIALGNDMEVFYRGLCSRVREDAEKVHEKVTEFANNYQVI